MRRGEYDAFDSLDLQRAFEKYGTLLRATITLDRETGQSRGFGFVSFESFEASPTNERCPASDVAVSFVSSFVASFPANATSPSTHRVTPSSCKPYTS